MVSRLLLRDNMPINSSEFILNSGETAGKMRSSFVAGAGEKFVGMRLLFSMGRKRQRFSQGAVERVLLVLLHGGAIKGPKMDKSRLSFARK